MRTWLARFVYGRFCRGSEAATGVEAFLEAAGVDGAADCTGDEALLLAVDSRRSRPESLLFWTVPSDMIVDELVRSLSST